MTAATITKTTTQKVTCPRCDGKGHLVGYSHIKNGVCFKCDGTGEVEARKPRSLKVNAEREAKRQQKIAARADLIEKAMNDDRVWNSPRMTVTRDHPSVEIHALEVYGWHEKFGW